MEMFRKDSRLLMVDDNPVDRSLFARALKQAGVENEIVVFGNGGKLIEYLRASLAFLNQPELDGHHFLVFLDLNMPVMDGRETLRVIKNDPQLKQIPIVVLTSSPLPHDINESYQDGANTVFAKPLYFNEMVALMDSVKSYWLQKAQWPFSVA